MTNPSPAQADTGSGGEPIGAIVKMKGLRFTPPEVSVDVGEAVRFVNDDNVAHTVLEDFGPRSGEIAAVDSDRILPGRDLHVRPARRRAISLRLHAAPDGDDRPDPGREARHASLSAVPWTACSSSTSPRVRPRTTSSTRRAAPCARPTGDRKTRVGHAGTLDPFATGLLLVLVGRATRIQRFLMALPKTYEVVARFGAVSTTGDPEGEITVTGAVPEGDLALPTGLVRQTPPIYSAVKVGGKRAYALARAGEEVVLAEREVTVTRFDELWRDGDRRGFAIECSSGTYVRSLIADLGDAYCLELRRTAIGPFSVDDAGGPDALDALLGPRATRSPSCRGSTSAPTRRGWPAFGRRGSRDCGGSRTAVRSRRRDRRRRAA